MKLILFFSTFLFFCGSLSAQEVKIFGEAQPGGLMIGKVDSVKDVYFDNTKIQIDSSGFFVFGFDRDDKGKFELTVNYLNGRSETKVFDLEKRDYNIQRINRMAKKYVNPPKEVSDKIERESKIMKSARAKIGEKQNAFFSSGFNKPVKKYRLSSVFGSQRILNGVPKSPHNGLDYAAPTGTPVYALTDGIVTIAGDNFYYNGNFVLLDHGQGLSSVYIHLNKTFVKDGDFVKKGQKIGEIGTTGRSTGPHLHWGVQWNKKRIDPALVLNIDLENINSK